MLSIVVPIYNADKYLRQCVGSIIGQSYQEFELILVDDGSEDDSLQICREYASRDKRIKLVLGNHKGPFYARKKGVENATGDYVTFVDADDFLAYDAYSLAKMDMAEGIEIIAFDIYRYFDEENIRYDKGLMPEGIYQKKDIEKQLFSTMIWNAEKESYGIDPSLCNKIFKSTLLKDGYSKLKNIEIHYGEDVAVIYPLIANAKSLHMHHKAYYYHRQRPMGLLPSYIEDKKYLNKLYELYVILSDNMSFDPVFQKQIDLFYINSANLVKKKYGLSTYSKDEIFPFDQVQKGSQVVIYGAGNIGQLYMRQLKQLNYCQVVLWVDQNYKQSEKDISSLELIRETAYDQLVIAIADPNIRKRVYEYLNEIGVPTSKIVRRIGDDT